RSASSSAPRTFFCRRRPSSGLVREVSGALEGGPALPEQRDSCGAGGDGVLRCVASRRYQPRVHPQRPRDDPAKGHPPRPLPPWRARVAMWAVPPGRKRRRVRVKALECAGVSSHPRLFFLFDGRYCVFLIDMK
ncbi:hypothetical protein TcCL_ESM02946, partial [Trypanosoma cruzi]